MPPTSRSGSAAASSISASSGTTSAKKSCSPRSLKRGTSSRSSARGRPTAAGGRSTGGSDGRGRARPRPPACATVPSRCESGGGPCRSFRGKGLWQKVRFAKRRLQQRSAGAGVRPRHRGGPSRSTRAIASADETRSCWTIRPRSAWPILASRPGSWPMPRQSRGAGTHSAADVPADPNRCRRPARTEAESQGCPRSLRRTEPGLVLLGDDRGSSRRSGTWMRSATRCPIGFAPFADEVVGIIRPIFEPDGTDRTEP